MAVRKSCYQDLMAIRLLPLQFTGRPVAGILHKQFRVLVLDARVKALVWEDEDEVSGFLALHNYEHRALSGRLMAIVHLAVREESAVLRLIGQAERTAREQQCDGLVIQTDRLSPDVIHFYKAMGYAPLGGALVKTLAFYRQAALEKYS